MDRNPLRWETAFIEDAKFEDESRTITRLISNTGGTALAYEIAGAIIDEVEGTKEDIPSWVNVFPTDGLLAPGGQQVVTFEFENDMVIGDYADTLFLYGAQDDEPFPIDFRVLCRPPEWELNPTIFTETMNFSLQLDIEGDLSNDQQDIVAAFIDGHLRGLAYVEYVPSLDIHEAFLTVYRDTSDGTTVTFQIWDASDCLLYGDIIETYTFDSDGLVGTPIQPDTLHTNNLLLRNIPLHSGWNWIRSTLNFLTTN